MNGVLISVLVYVCVYWRDLSAYAGKLCVCMAHGSVDMLSGRVMVLCGEWVCVFMICVCLFVIEYLSRRVLYIV